MDNAFYELVMTATLKCQGKQMTVEKTGGDSSGNSYCMGDESMTFLEIVGLLENTSRGYKKMAFK